MKQTGVIFLTVSLGAFLATVALAAAPKSLPVTAADLTAAGVAGVVEVAPAQGRFPASVRYFRITEKLSAADAKRDCADCTDLVAVYAAEAPVAPNWVTQLSGRSIKIGGRLQVRTYLQSKKRIVTVTAPSEATVRKISDALVSKFSK